MVILYFIITISEIKKFKFYLDFLPFLSSHILDEGMDLGTLKEAHKFSTTTRTKARVLSLKIAKKDRKIVENDMEIAELKARFNNEKRLIYKRAEYEMKEKYKAKLRQYREEYDTKLHELKLQFYDTQVKSIDKGRIIFKIKYFRNFNS